MKKYLIYLFAIFFFASCEDVVDVNLEDSVPQLTVDGWITDQLDTQVIKLTISQPYFSNSFNPPALDAIVVVASEDGDIYNFTDEDRDGRYIYVPQGKPLAVVGKKYGLSIAYKGNNFVAATEIHPVPPIDSLVYTFEEEILGAPEGYYAQFYARDLEGIGNCYWIKAYKNGRFLNRSAEINIAYDAAFSFGSNADGLTFIRPIREGINPFGDDDADPQTDPLPPYSLGDSIYVELHAIPFEAFVFLAELRLQTSQGGLFAAPLSNVPTNVFNANQNSTEKAIGFFGGSAVSKMGVRIVE